MTGRDAIIIGRYLIVIGRNVIVIISRPILCDMTDLNYTATYCIAIIVLRWISMGSRQILCNVIGWEYVATYFNYIATDFNIRSWSMGRVLTQTANHHYDDIIMTAMASQITSLTSVYSTVYSGADQRKHQSSASLAFVRGIHRRPVNSPHKGGSNAENVSIWWRHHHNAGLLIGPLLDILDWSAQHTDPTRT